MTWTSEEILKAIGEYAPDECITEKKLTKLTPYNDRQIENALKRLMNHGFVERTAPGCYELTDAGRIAIGDGARIRSGSRGEKERAYTTAACARRSGAHFAIAKTQRPRDRATGLHRNRKNPRSNIHHYVNLLEEAGYIVRMKKKVPGTSPTSNGFARWLLLDEKNTGPMAPVYRPTKMAMYDPNTEKETKLCG